jgi:hypothetical protein
MDKISSGVSVSAASASQSSRPVQNQVQVSMLKKTLEGQKSEVAQLLQALEGKGKIVDIRV